MAKTKKMTDNELQRLVSGIVTDAIEFSDNELAPERAQATDYYKGEPFGNEEPGRSQFVVTEVRDHVLAVLPDVLRVVFGPERVVEFAPRNEQQAKLAAQASDAIQYTFAEENQGFLVAHSVLKDGLVRRLGVVKWGWSDDSATQAYKITGVPQSQLEMWAEDPAVELNRVVQTSEGAPALVGPDGQPAGTPSEAEYTVELTHTERDGRPWVKPVPPEEFLYDREARSLDDALFVAHRTRKTEGELVAMGISAKDIEEHGGDDESLLDSEDETARRGPTVVGGPNPEAGDANDKHLYIEGYVRIDYDGDGVAELRKICTIGPAYHVVVNEPTDERPFAIFCPDPEPHTMTGQSWADRTMDIQLVKSQLVRASLDSLAASIFPRTAYVENQVSVADILNTEIGAPIRMRAPGMIQPVLTPYVGKEAHPLLEYMTDVAESRTGKSKGVVGLDADALQSSTQSAVAAAISASQAQSELLVRIFAEQTLKPLFRGLLRLMSKNSSRQRMMKLRGEWTPVNPSVWDADMDVVVNVAMGVGSLERKIMIMQGIIQKQEMILQTLGPMNPIVNLNQYSNALRDAIELGGRKDVTRYFTEVPKNWQPPQGPPQPDAEMEFVKVEAAKNQAAAQAKMQELQIKMAQLQAESQLEQQTLQLKLAEAESKAAADQAKMQLASKTEEDKQLVALEQTRVEIEARLAAEQQKIEAQRMQLAAEHQQALAELELKGATELQIAQMKIALEREKMEVERQIAEKDIAQKERVAMQKLEMDMKHFHEQHRHEREQERSKQEAAAPPKPVGFRVVRDADNRIVGVEPNTSTGKTNGND